MPRAGHVLTVAGSTAAVAAATRKTPLGASERERERREREKRAASDAEGNRR